MTNRPADLHVYPLTCENVTSVDEFDSRRPLDADLQGCESEATGVHASYTNRPRKPLWTSAFRLITTTVFAIAALGFAAQGQAQAEGKVRWEKPALTVHVADAKAWAGTDVAAALAQWSPALPLVLTDDADADVILTAGGSRTEAVGATAHTDSDGSALTGCTVTLAAKYAGKGMTDVLAHELGHCLGLGHAVDGPSVMMWTDLDAGFSPTVTAADLDAVRNLYR